jgi:hypothetical protein
MKTLKEAGPYEDDKTCLMNVQGLMRPLKETAALIGSY